MLSRVVAIFALHYLIVVTAAVPLGVNPKGEQMRSPCDMLSSIHTQCISYYMSHINTIIHVNTSKIALTWIGISQRQLASKATCSSAARGKRYPSQRFAKLG